MARMMSKSRPQNEGSTQVKFSEMIVIGLVLVGVGFAVKYYLEYRKGPSFALAQYLDAVKGGSSKVQYEFIDQKDKSSWCPTLSEYESKCQLSHGYAERIENYNISPETKDASKPDYSSIKTVVTIRGMAGKELYQNGTAETYTDTFRMHRAADGAWKLIYMDSVSPSTRKLNMEKATPTPNSSY